MCASLAINFIWRDWSPPSEQQAHQLLIGQRLWNCFFSRWEFLPVKRVSLDCYTGGNNRKQYWNHHVISCRVRLNIMSFLFSFFFHGSLMAYIWEQGLIWKLFLAEIDGTLRWFWEGKRKHLLSRISKWCVLEIVNARLWAELNSPLQNSLVGLHCCHIEWIDGSARTGSLICVFWSPLFQIIPTPSRTAALWGVVITVWKYWA